MHDPERLALDVLTDGLAAGGVTKSGDTSARAANYVSATSFDGGAVALRDESTGEEFPFTARVVINTSGPWTDLTNAALGKPTRFMGGTKGSHVVLDHPELLDATGGREIFFEHSDGRIVLVYPLKDRVMIGTTDIDADPRDSSVCTDDEVDYFFDLIPHVFPDITVDRSQIVYSFSGIRPLPRHDDTAPGFVSRDYRIEHGWLGGVRTLSLVGGKWTTFRALAEHLGNETLQLLGKKRRVSTRNTVIGGASGYPLDRAARRIWVSKHARRHSADLVDHLLNRYGTNAAHVIAALPDEPSELSAAPGYYAEELAYLARTEQVLHLDDMLLRRTSIAFVGGLTHDTLTQVADAIAPELGWDAAAVESEVERAELILRKSHRVQVGVPGLAPVR